MKTAIVQKETLADGTTVFCAAMTAFESPGVYRKDVNPKEVPELVALDEFAGCDLDMFTKAIAADDGGAALKALGLDDGAIARASEVHREYVQMRSVLRLAAKAQPFVFSDEACTVPLFETAMEGAKLYSVGELDQMTMGIGRASTRGREDAAFRGSGGEVEGAPPSPNGGGVR